MLGTLTDYDSQGNVVASKRYDGVNITIDADPTYAGVMDANFHSSGTAISSTQTWYDEQGRVIETESASGLRTGTIYYPDGRVQYTGELKNSAPDGGEITAVPGTAISTIGFALGDFATYTGYTYDQPAPTAGETIDSVTDADGHTTDTYTDAAGRTVNVVYADGSYSPTYYGTDANPVTAVAAPAGLIIPAGGTETVTIDQMKDGDPVNATFKVYDAAGNLTDVYLPAVIDGNTSDAAFGTAVAPHWSYTYDVTATLTGGSETGTQLVSRGSQKRCSLCCK